MTRGPILRAILLFSLPLMLGNAFQMLYNTVDVIVVGNYVGKEALAAVGSTTMIVNIQVFFFNGFSIGAGVVIGRYFGAKDQERLHAAVETTMAMTLILCALFLIMGHLDPAAKGLKKTLRITIPENLNYEGVFDGLLNKYCTAWKLDHVKTTNMGSMFKLRYELTMRPGVSEKDMIDQLRLHNGNLEITLAQAANAASDL